MKPFTRFLVIGSSMVATVCCSCKPAEAPPPDGNPVLPPESSVVDGRRPTRRPETTPSNFTNLKVLPRDITKDELLETMKLVSKSLGAKCDLCHRTDTRDYASDEIEEKRTAREMMRMVDRINAEHFTWEGAPEATCFMCHHGQRTPEMKP